jgi:hypothetical protein
MSNDLSTEQRNHWVRWFQVAMWLGILQDFVLAFPTIFWPAQMLTLLGQTAPVDTTWVSFASAVLVVLGAMYIPAAWNPYRYPWTAWLAVMARPPGVIFFFFLYAGTYPVFGWVDLILTSLQLPLLLLTFFAPREGGVDLADRIAADRWKAQPEGEYRGTSLNRIKQVVWSDIYETLPYHVGLGPLKLVQFFNHACRNLADKRDLLPYFDKLIHPNGISFTGTWEITASTPYTGYFQTGSKGLVLVRASVAGLLTQSGTYRSFGIGGKVFPTMDPDEVVYPGNFVTVSRLSGIRTKHIVDIEMTNRPTVGLDPAANLVSRVIFRLMDKRPGFRQLHPVSRLGLAECEPDVTPDLMMLRITAGTPRVHRKDFRDEMRLEHYPGNQLVYDILVRNLDDAAWNTIGKMVLTDYAISESGDKRLHFWIPRDRLTTTESKLQLGAQGEPGRYASAAPQLHQPENSQAGSLRHVDSK